MEWNLMERLVQVARKVWTAELDPSTEVSVQPVAEGDAVLLTDLIQSDPLCVHARPHVATVLEDGVRYVVEVEDPESQVRGRVGTMDEWERMREIIVTMRRDWYLVVRAGGTG